MTYPITEARLEILRNDLHALKDTVQRLRQDHDAHIREVVAEREKREVARFIRLCVLIGILGALDVISVLMPLG